MKILFATDGSPNAQKAATFLSKLDFSSRYKLVIATVSYDPAYSPSEHVTWADDWRDHERVRVESSHDDVVSTLEGQFESVTRIHETGAPKREIMKIAEQQQPDLIVIGAVGHSAVRRLILGSFSDHVATHASCSVLVVRPHELESDEPLNRIMVAFDSSEPSNELVAELEKYKLSEQAELSVTTVLHEYEYLTSDLMADTLYERQRKWFDEQRTANSGAVARLSNSFPRVCSVIEKGISPDDALIAIAEEKNLQLVMVGDAGHTFWEDLAMGSTTKYLLRHAPCSVWISRHHRIESNDDDSAEVTESVEA